MMNTISSIFIKCILLINLVSQSLQVSFYLQPNTHKCFSEEIHKDVLVAGEFDIQDIQEQSVEIQVTDSKEQVLYSKEHAKTGKFIFNTEHDDLYRVCFICQVSAASRGSQQLVKFKSKHGVEAKSYESYGEAAKLKPLEVELKRLEDLSESVVKHFAYMREREQQMRDTNESTNSRVLYFSLFSLCCLIGLATWQVLYLRKFFKAKKLIE